MLRLYVELCCILFLEQKGKSLALIPRSWIAHHYLHYPNCLIMPYGFPKHMHECVLQSARYDPYFCHIFFMSLDFSDFLFNKFEQFFKKFCWIVFFWELPFMVLFLSILLFFHWIYIYIYTYTHTHNIDKERQYMYVNVYIYIMYLRQHILDIYVYIYTYYIDMY